MEKSYIDEEKWLEWIDTLAQEDIVVIDQFLPQNLWQELRNFLLEKLQDMDKAGIGVGAENQVISEIRGDYTFWLEPSRDTHINQFFDVMEELQSQLNRYCYLSLSGSEFHLAHYPAGSYYKKHLDQFGSRSNRLITFILYLNEYWEPFHEGQLKIYPKNGQNREIAPQSNRAVIFKSDKLPHEVLPTTVSRYSVTGWFLYQRSGVGFLG